MFGYLFLSLVVSGLFGYTGYVLTGTATGSGIVCLVGLAGGAIGWLAKSTVQMGELNTSLLKEINRDTKQR